MSGITGTSHSKSKIVGRSPDTAKAWINFAGNFANSSADMSGVRDTFNVSSLVQAGAGRYTINFMTNMPNNDFVVAGSHNINANETSWNNGNEFTICNPLVGSFLLVTYNSSSSAYAEAGYVCAVVFGD
jgi:hypothetical protein